MNHDILKQVIFDQIEVIQNAEIIPRDYFFEKNVNYVLVGLRRSGTSNSSCHRRTFFSIWLTH